MTSPLALTIAFAATVLVACAATEPAATTPTVATAAPAPSEMVVGLWTGTMTQADGEKLPVTFSVGRNANALSIEFAIPAAGMTRAFTNVLLQGNKLTFNFAPMVTCELNRQADASFAGVCTENKGDYSKIMMTMVPPK